MIERVISGGQTGADQAGWRAAKRFGIATGGWMPRTFMTETGCRPEFGWLYGAQEHKSQKYAARRIDNIRESDAVLVFASDPNSPGSKQTALEAFHLEIPFVVVKVYGAPGERRRIEALAHIWLKEIKPKVLMIAGNRESKSPGIGAWVEGHLGELFRYLGFTEIEP